MLGKTNEAPARETGSSVRVVAPLLPLHDRIMLSRPYLVHWMPSSILGHKTICNPEPLDYKLDFFDAA
ncbi:hypothetical protein Ccrd_025949 [Cynara cardunculus var. scolymus]|uniref:Uncharacterized protein n=1 Tax=Cynara cardunculus var. scolymus TaxID=59895 RepID=A0A103XDM3_CYNCS|nr:hypothetical protein Ccrd_025949 [Cynara cardunculus var. scolymus]